MLIFFFGYTQFERHSKLFNTLDVNFLTSKLKSEGWEKAGGHKKKKEVGGANFLSSPARSLKHKKGGSQQLQAIKLISEINPI